MVCNTASGDAEVQRFRTRGGARAEASYRRVLNQVRADTGIEDEGQAHNALEIVLGALLQRLIPGEAEDLAAQLPSLSHRSLYVLPLGPDKQITRETMELELVRQLDVEPAYAANLRDRIGALIAQIVSPGQMKDVQGQLPKPLREVFSHATSPVAW